MSVSVFWLYKKGYRENEDRAVILWWVSILWWFWHVSCVFKCAIRYLAFYYGFALKCGLDCLSWCIGTGFGSVLSYFEMFDMIPLVFGGFVGRSRRCRYTGFELEWVAFSMVVAVA